MKIYDNFIDSCFHACFFLNVNKAPSMHVSWNAVNPFGWSKSEEFIMLYHVQFG